MSDASITLALRGTMFGDQPMDQWPRADDARGALWEAFKAARACAAGGDMAGAIDVWRRIAGMQGIESRHTLQAWAFLRAHGEAPPPDEARRVLGVVLEMPMSDTGFDLLAAYADCTARWVKYTGLAVLWDAPEPATDGPLRALLAAAQRTVERIGPWEGARPGLPPSGHARLNILTPSGLHFGQGPVGVLARDPLGGEIIARGTDLLQAMIARGGRGGE